MLKPFLFIFSAFITSLDCFSQNVFPNPGNVGIGTNNPQVPLYIKGSSFWGTLRISPNAESAETGIGFSTHTLETDISNMWFMGLGGWNTGQNFVIGTGSSPSITLFTSGNIGIGTTDSKGYKFAVAGTAIAEAMTVKLQGAWPDYVFNHNYHRPILSEVEHYINQSGHLPEMPSEQQVAKEGINLGEMNKLLVKKVEELTLYLIEKDKELKKQVRINQNQEQRLKKIEQKLH